LKKLIWHKTADALPELQFSEAGLTEVEVAGKKVCLTLHKEQLYACAAKCPHAGGVMANGYTDALGNIVCPLHRYKFSLPNGRNTSGEGYFLKTYPIESRPEGIFIGFEENNLFSWLK
jgi:nitrite reductase/ring-hydroxylating ferredoxin subunit